MEENTEERGPMWVVVMAFVAIFIWSFYGQPHFIHEGMRLDSPEQLGSASADLSVDALIKSLVVWLVLGIVLRRTPARAWSGVTFAALFATVVIVEGATLFVTDRMARSAAEDAQLRIAAHESQKILAVMENPNGTTIDTTIKAHGEAGEVERITKQIASEMLQVRTDYNAEMKAIDFPAFLAPQRFASDRGLVKTRAKLKQARQILTTQRAKVRMLSAKYRAAVMGAPIGDALKKQILKGYEESSAQRMAALDRLWQCDDDFLTEFQTMLGDLAHSKAAWIARGNVIQFSNQHDLAVYRRHANRIQMLAQQEKDMLAALHSEVVQDIHAPIPTH